MTRMCFLVPTFLCLLCISAVNSSEEPKLSRFEFSQPHMGTLFQITLFTATEGAARKAAQAAFDRVAELDGIMSDYRQTSELMRLCKQAGGPPVPVSRELFEVLWYSQELAARSGGAFDVTIGPVVRLWRRARRQRELPDPQRLSQALKLVGHNKVRLDAKNRTVQLLKKDMLIDLGGIAKGYAGDEALRVLKKHGVNIALVAASGDIVAGDSPPGKAGWSLEIARLKTDKPSDAKPQRLLLSNAAVSTSGDAEQFVEIGAERYSHIIDPRTGMAVQGQSSVTVIAPTGTASDSFATAVSVLGPRRGFELIEATPGAAALYVQATATGLHSFQSKRWGERGTSTPR